MTFKNIHPVDVAYDNKAFGNLIDPYEWNNNFQVLEQNITQNATSLNENFGSISSSSGASTIGVKNLFLGDESLSNVEVQLMLLVSRVINTYTNSELDAKFANINSNTIQKIEYNSDNGCFTITRNDGTVSNIDTNIEKIPVSVSLENVNDSVILVITNYDGSTSSADVTNLLNIYTFTNSSTLLFSNTNNDISAEIKAASIKPEHLAGEVVASIENAVTLANSYALNAEASKNAAVSAQNSAQESALLSQSYANGTSGYRSGENVDNAKYYSEQSKNSAVSASNFADNAANSALLAEEAKNAAQEIVGADFVTHNELTAALQDKVSIEAGKGLSTNDYTNEDKASVQKISGIEAELQNKVPIEAGKGLSTNDYTNEDKTEVSKIAGKENKATFSLYTILASGWSAEGTYSFETLYPVASYDLEISLSENTTVEQAEAFVGALIVGSSTTNVIKALGDVPIVDIEVLVKVVAK